MSKLYGINRDLAKLAGSGKEIRVGLIGAGNMGTDIISQFYAMKGIKAAAVADIRLDYAYRGYELAGVRRGDIVRADNTAVADAAVAQGKPVVTEDGFLLTRMETLEVTRPPATRR